jgi:hypothetical protein
MSQINQKKQCIKKITKNNNQSKKGTSTKHSYSFCVTRCASNAFCILNSKVLRQWGQEFDGR